MNWGGPTLTDSGGFQVMSLGVGFKKVISMNVDESSQSVESSAKKGHHGGQNDSPSLTQIDDDGVTFRSHIDGDLLRFTPEISLDIQHKLGADIMFAFDELTTLMHDYAYQIESLDNRTHPWALRSLVAHYEQTVARPGKPYQALFGVLQGANYEDLRRRTAETLATMEHEGMGFDGFGIGGALEKERIGEIVGWCSETLNKFDALGGPNYSRPRHLLGISAIDDIFAGAENGVDTFDCVSPSREARNGAIYTRDGRYNVKNARYRDDYTPLDPDCSCYTCANYSRAYVNHLIRVGELNGSTLATIHNEAFIVRLVDNIRESLLTGNFANYRDEFLTRFYVQ
jgi:queuine tRNA-ribosyltransferase